MMRPDVCENRHKYSSKLRNEMIFFRAKGDRAKKRNYGGLHIKSMHPVFSMNASHQKHMQ